jgi:hypothetical protein
VCDCWSDSRLKENIENQEETLKKIKQIQAITFKYNEKGVDLQKMMEGGIPNDEDVNLEQIGFMAEEIEKVFPELVEYVEVEDQKYRAVSYIQMIPILLNSIKELDQKVCELENKKENDNERDETK